MYRGTLNWYTKCIGSVTPIYSVCAGGTVITHP